MTRASRRILLAVLVGVAAVGVALDGQDPATPSLPRPAATAQGSLSSRNAAPRPTRSQVNRQDQVSAAHRRRETRAFDDRPLLAVLPLELAGVKIEITGLARDGRTELEVRPGPQGSGYARSLYRRALAVYGDSGNAYTVRWR